MKKKSRPNNKWNPRGWSFITTFKIPSSRGKTNPFEITACALLGVHKSTRAERRGGTAKTGAGKLLH